MGYFGCCNTPELIMIIFTEFINDTSVKFVDGISNGSIYHTIQCLLS